MYIIYLYNIHIYIHIYIYIYTCICLYMYILYKYIHVYLSHGPCLAAGCQSAVSPALVGFQERNQVLLPTGGRATAVSHTLSTQAMCNIFTYMCVHTFTYICIYIYIYVHMYIHIQMCMYICTYIALNRLSSEWLQIYV